MIRYRDISEAWFSVCRSTKFDGYRQDIDRGSFEKEDTYRLQNESLAFEILHPETRPLGVSSRGRVVVTQPEVEKYFMEYIIGTEVAENELYTYASRIVPCLDALVCMLKETPHTNQAVIEVAHPQDIFLEHPPCLRILDWKVVNGKLNLTSYWRSWALYSALPTNLGGLQLLNELVSEETGIPTGKLICFSSGSHLYSYELSFFDD